MFLVNPNRVLFRLTAQVNVGSLVVSTLALSTAKFMAGHAQFGSGSGSAGGGSAIINQANITAHSAGSAGGTIALMVATVTDTGLIEAQTLATGKQGKIILSAGHAIVNTGWLDASAAPTASANAGGSITLNTRNLIDADILCASSASGQRPGRQRADKRQRHRFANCSQHPAGRWRCAGLTRPPQ